MREKTKFGERTKAEGYKKEYRKVLVFAEGQVTEIEYFKGVEDNKKVIGIPALLKVEPIKRPTEKAMWSNISRIIRFIEEKKLNATKDKIEFLRDDDELWIVFDRDQITKNQFEDAKKYAEEENYNIGFTNSLFEIWLLLHFEGFNKYTDNQLIFSKENKEFIINEIIKLSNGGLYGKNKKHVRFEKFIEGINLACQQSEKLCNDLDLLFDNIGTTLNKMMNSLIDE